MVSSATMFIGPRHVYSEPTIALVLKGAFSATNATLRLRAFLATSAIAAWLISSTPALIRPTTCTVRTFFLACSRAFLSLGDTAKEIRPCRARRFAIGVSSSPVGQVWTARHFGNFAGRLRFRLRLVKALQERLRGAQIAGGEALGELPVGARQNLTPLGSAAAIGLEETGETRRRPQCERHLASALRKLECKPKLLFGLARGLQIRLPQEFAFEAMNLGGEEGLSLLAAQRGERL